MKNIEAIKARYLKEPFQRKLGHLASDLARVHSFSENRANSKIVEDIVEESKFFIEWIAPEAPFNLQVILSEIQLKLALLHRRLASGSRFSGEIKELARPAKAWSRQLIEFSGLLSA